MPEIQDLEYFKGTLREVGNEVEILLARGEEAEDPPVPSAAVSEDISQLFGDTGEFDVDQDLKNLDSDLHESDALDQLPGEFQDDFIGEDFFSSEIPKDEVVTPAGEVPSAGETESLPDFTSEEDAFSPIAFENLFGDETKQEEPADIFPEEPSADVLPEDMSLEDMMLSDEVVPAADEGGLLQEETRQDDMFSGSEAGPGDFPDESVEIPEEIGEGIDFSLDLPDDQGLPAADEEPFTPFEAESGESREITDLEAEGEAVQEPPPEEPKADEQVTFDGLNFDADFPFEGEEGKEKADDFADFDSFDIKSFESDFGIGDEAEPSVFSETFQEELESAVEEPAMAELQQEEMTVSDEDFKLIQNTLQRLPRNLKIAIEELIGEQGLTGEPLLLLLQTLVKGASARELAAAAEKISGKRIKIPAQYEKRTGAEFEERLGTFPYIFRHTIWPLLRVVLIAVVSFGMLTYLGYSFVYRPVKAASLYRRGLQEIGVNNIETGNLLFRKAFGLWPEKKQFYSYAEAFRTKYQYYYAEDKYNELIARYGYQRKAYLDYADMEATERARFENAEKLLKRVIQEKVNDYDAKLALGDTYILWAAEVPEKYELGRRQYAELIQYYGTAKHDELNFRMLNYFMAVNSFNEVLRLKDLYLDQRKDREVDPQIFTKLGGYLIDHENLADVRQVLNRVLMVEGDLPSTYYQLARYFKTLKDYGEERRSLTTAIFLGNQIEALNTDEYKVLIDSHNRLGQNYYRENEIISALDEYNTALDLYDQAVTRRLVTPAPVYGQIYSNLGDVYYYKRSEYDTALDFFNKAAELGYQPKENTYKQGYIYYVKQDFLPALEKFYDSEESFEENRNVIFALANTLYQRKSLGLAYGYYLQLEKLLEQEINTIAVLLPSEREDHYALLENMMKVENNIGVTLYNLYLRDGDSKKIGLSQNYLTRATLYMDQLLRDPETLEASDEYQLSQINIRNFLYPIGGYEMQIYNHIPKDTSALKLE